MGVRCGGKRPPWLRILTPQVGGPQKAAISFEVDAGAILNVPISEAKVTVAGQRRAKTTGPRGGRIDPSIGMWPPPRHHAGRPEPAREKIAVRDRVTAITDAAAVARPPMPPTAAASVPALRPVGAPGHGHGVPADQAMSDSGKRSLGSALPRCARRRPASINAMPRKARFEN